VSSSAERIQVRPARWPWAVVAVFVIIATIGMILVATNGEALAEQVPFVIAFAMFGVMGAFIVSRDRRNTIGLLCLYGSFMTATAFSSAEIFTWLVSDGQDGWWVVLLGFLNTLGWLLGVPPVIFLLPLLFPDGQLPSRRWRPLLGLIGVFVAVISIGVVLGERRLTGSNETDGIQNPFYVDAIGRLPSLDLVLAVLFPTIFALSVGSLFLRFRRSSGVERQQIKWVAFGLLAALVGIVGSEFIAEPVLSAVVGGCAFLAFPVSIGIAVLRFRLYDLDVVIRKAVVYAILAVLATIVYLCVVVGAGVWLGRDNSFLTMVAAVFVAVTFQPVRARLTRFANRLVYGKRATPYEVLSEFSERVGGAYADEDVLPRMVRVLGEGVGAERADVWLAVDRELRDVAVWPADSSGRPSIPLPNGSMPQIDGMDRVYPVEQAGELLGALTVRKPSSDPISPADEKLIADLASQAGLVLRNVRLSEALKARLDDLKAAQRRLVSAQDAERRRLERNIHDGAQQQLVALAVKARLARQLTDRDPAKAASMLEQIEAETQTALEDLRDLARGIYPPLLADKGLASALEAQARKSGLPVTVDASVDRFPQELEAAVYFSCLEAMQNVAKYADAQHISVTLRSEGGAVEFAVTDDGSGFDPATTNYGSGLRGMADRLAALDGDLEVRSTPGRGTTIRGRVPIDPRQAKAREERVEASGILLGAGETS
jgi:signal transduction histidine kinase